MKRTFARQISVLASRARIAGVSAFAVCLAVLAVPSAAEAAETPVIVFSCNPDSVNPGEPVTCRVDVGAVLDPVPSSPPAPTGTVTFSNGTRDGAFTPSRCTLKFGAGAGAWCTTTYTPQGRGSEFRKDTLTARYSGDSVYDAARDTETVAVTAPAIGTLDPDLSVSCPSSVRETNSVMCTARARGNNLVNTDPTGRVALKGSRGTVDPESCTLVSIDRGSSFCTFKYKPSGSGSSSRSDTVTVTYPGSPLFAKATATTKISVIPREKSPFTVECEDVVETNSGTCVARVQALGQFPDGQTTGGSVVFSSARGDFAPKTCTLEPSGMPSHEDPFFGSECSAVYTPEGSGTSSRKDAITVSFLGDDVFAPTKVTTSAAVRPRLVPDLSVNCEAVMEGKSVQCEVSAIATGPPFGTPPTGPVRLSSTRGSVTSSCSLGNPSTFENGSTVIYVSGCHVTYAPEGAATASRKDTIKVSYGGDSNYRPASGSGRVEVKPRLSADASLSCAPVIEGKSTSCVARLEGPGYFPDGLQPTGQVRFSSPDGTFSTESCTLVKDGMPSGQLPTEFGSECTTVYKPTGNGTTTRKDTITVLYGGDAEFRSQKFSASIPVPPRPTPDMSVNCDDTTTGNPTQCEVVLLGKGNATGGTWASGQVVFTSNDGTFTRSTCQTSGDDTPLSDFYISSCTTYYQPSGTGSAYRKDTVKATFAGSPDYRQASDSDSFKVGPVL